MLDTGLRHVELDDIRRQRKAEHISAIRSMIAGDVSGAMRTLAKHTHEIADESDRLNAIVDRWSKLESRDSALVITSRQATKNTLNDKMRDVLRQEGKLQDERSTEQITPVFSSRADLKLASAYSVGDTVRFNQNAKSIGAKNSPIGIHARLGQDFRDPYSFSGHASPRSPAERRLSGPATTPNSGSEMDNG